MSATPPVGLDLELVRRFASEIDNVTFDGLDLADRERYERIARWLLDYVGDDDFHWGCTSAEAAEKARENAHDDGFEAGFEEARSRIVAGIETLVARSMVEAELAVEVIPRIRAMTPWDNAAPRGNGDRVFPPQVQA